VFEWVIELPAQKSLKPIFNPLPVEEYTVAIPLK
jgi:hypothetical protein